MNKEDFTKYVLKQVEVELDSVVTKEQFYKVFNFFKCYYNKEISKENNEDNILYNSKVLHVLNKHDKFVFNLLNKFLHYNRDFIQDHHINILKEFLKTNHLQHAIIDYNSNNNVNIAYLPYSLLYLNEEIIKKDYTNRNPGKNLKVLEQCYSNLFHILVNNDNDIKNYILKECKSDNVFFEKTLIDYLSEINPKVLNNVLDNLLKIKVSNNDDMKLSTIEDISKILVHYDEDVVKNLNKLFLDNVNLYDLRSDDVINILFKLNSKDRLIILDDKIKSIKENELISFINIMFKYNESNKIDLKNDNDLIDKLLIGLKKYDFDKILLLSDINLTDKDYNNTRLKIIEQKIHRKITALKVFHILSYVDVNDKLDVGVDKEAVTFYREKCLSYFNINEYIEFISYSNHVFNEKNLLDEEFRSINEKNFKLLEKNRKISLIKKGVYSKVNLNDKFSVFVSNILNKFERKNKVNDLNLIEDKKINNEIKDVKENEIKKEAIQEKTQNISYFTKQDISKMSYSVKQKLLEIEKNYLLLSKEREYYYVFSIEDKLYLEKECMPIIENIIKNLSSLSKYQEESEIEVSQYNMYKSLDNVNNYLLECKEKIKKEIKLKVDAEIYIQNTKTTNKM